MGEGAHHSRCQGTEGQLEATRATSIIDTRGISDVVHLVCMLAEGILMMNFKGFCRPWKCHFLLPSDAR